MLSTAVQTNAEINYPLLFHGLAFLAMAGAALAARRDLDRRVPWPWLASFGSIYALSQWLDLVTLGRRDPAAFVALRLAVLATSFVALLEFGRRGFTYRGGRVLSRWIHLPLAGAAALGALAWGTSALETACRYAMGLPAGILAGLALAQAARSAERAERPGLRLAALAMLLGAPAVGLNIPWAAACCALGAMTGIWLAHCTRRSPTEPPSLFRRWLPPAACTLLCVVGAIAADRSTTSARAPMQWELREATPAAEADMVYLADPENSAAALKDLKLQRLRAGLTVFSVTLLLVVLVAAASALFHPASPRKPAVRTARGIR